MKKRFVFISVIVLLAACSKEINLDLPPYTSKIVVNGEFNTDNDMSVQVSRSLGILQPNDSTGYLLQGATVKIYEEPTLLGTAPYIGGFYTLAGQKPKAGKTYRVEVTSPGYGGAAARLIMPKALNITTGFIDSIGVDPDGLKVGQLSLSFTDDPSEKNYYRLQIRYYNAGILTWFNFDFTSTDIIFLNNPKLKDGSYLFSDRTFSGKTKTLTFNVPFGLVTGSPKFEVSIKSFSEDYYTYLQQTDNYSQNGNGISNEPVILRSNVTNGLGMVGGVSNARDTLF